MGCGEGKGVDARVFYCDRAWPIIRSKAQSHLIFEVRTCCRGDVCNPHYSGAKTVSEATAKVWTLSANDMLDDDVVRSTLNCVHCLLPLHTYLTCMYV